MSLLASLIKAGTQFQQTLEKPPQPATGKSAQTAVKSAPNAGSVSGNDDRFTLSERAELNLEQAKSSKLAMTEYRQTIGQDLAFVRETLRHKLAEYQVNPATHIEVSRGESGAIQLGGNLPGQSLERIQQDLNNSQPFREAFSRLSASEPTLHFMDNALKLNKAYGVNNSLLDSIVSENQQFNGLQDLIHRYDSVRRNVTATESEAFPDPRHYAFSLNTQA